MILPICSFVFILNFNICGPLSKCYLPFISRLNWIIGETHFFFFFLSVPGRGGLGGGGGEREKMKHISSVLIIVYFLTQLDPKRLLSGL